MRPRRGVTVGKFLPLHKGHELLLQAAATHCNELTVLVGVTPNDPYSFEQRKRWITAAIQAGNQNTATMAIVADPDPDPNVAKDAEGTVVDERYWQRWLEQNAETLRDIELVFTSDPYGQELARRIGASWFPVDPTRETVPVSARQIRKDRRAYFHFVSDGAKPDVALTVAVVGAESTGKSMLVRALAEHYSTTYAPEWGRTISDARDALSVADFDAILSMQKLLIRRAQLDSDGLCFTDTEAITTALYAPIYLGEEHANAWHIAREQRFSLYLLLDPTVPWVDDGTRVLDQPKRQAFHQALIEALDRFGAPYQVIAGSSYEERQRQATLAVDALLTTSSR
ncbi:MAG: AAA family ATPase [Pseudomonadota bacterium]